MNEYKISFIASIIIGKIDVCAIEIPDIEIEEGQPEANEIEYTYNIKEIES